MRFLLALLMSLLFAASLSGGCGAGGDTEEDGATNCTIGAEGCRCTEGGACDTGLECLSNRCVDPNGGGMGGSGAGFGNGGTGNDDCVPGEGCQAVDVIFALDSSASMIEENSALTATQAFTSVVQALAGINCGQIDYRVGITNDNDDGFFTPSGWSGAVPWFDSLDMSDTEIATAFNGAAQGVIGGDAASTGCEHTLTSASRLLQSDTTGFVREGALLVLVLVSDVDDHAAYDHDAEPPTGDPCRPCTEPVTLETTHHADLVALKGDAAAVATIVLAGDPNDTNGDQTNFCGAPGACGCTFVNPIGYDCAVHHATKLYNFASLCGANGVTYDLCAGAATLPAAVEDAFRNQINLACQELEPPA